jgi:predicted DNA-binding transcriptional regulator YafY
MASTNKNQSKLIRIGQILRILMEKDHVSCDWLSKQFQTTARTIQRDLLLLKTSGFPVHEIHKGSYGLRKDLLKHLEIFDDTELAVIVAIKNIVGQLGIPFQKAADNVLDRLYDSMTNMPVFVKIDDAVLLDSLLLNRIVKAIRAKKQVNFQYTAGKGAHPVCLEPYRVAYFSGFWYLIGNETNTGILKSYALDKVSDLKASKATFKSIPEQLDSVLQSSANIWATNAQNLEVTVLIDANVSHYFKRRKMFPTQEIKEERPDGSLVVSYKVGHYEAIRNMLKSWIPRIVILGPDDFKNELLEDVKKWVKKQEG